MKRYFKLLLILLLLGSAVGSQYLFDKERKSYKASAQYQPLVVTDSALSKFNLGLKPAIADLYWLQAIQYYGDWRDDHNYQKLADYLTVTTELDPKFSYPYAFAALILPSEKMDQGYNIAKKGVDLNLPDWQIPYFLATAYHIYKEDKTEAAKYFDIAARTSGAPDNLKYISYAYNSSPNNRSTGKAIWQGIYDNSTDESMKDRAKDYIYHYELLDFYETAAKEYQKKTGSWPKNLDELKSGGILRELPPDPFGLNLRFTDEGRITANPNE